MRRVAQSAVRQLSKLTMLGILIALGACREGRIHAHPDLVLVVIDTLRRDHLATYGYARNDAPTIERLAREGAVADGLSPSSWTKPSVASLLTGLHPIRHQAIGRSDRLATGAITLAQVLRAHGYHTLGVSANSWVSKDFGFDRGFDDFELLEDSGNRHAYAREVNAQLSRPLSKLRSPFFLYVHYIDPHEPYNPHVAWNGSPLPSDLVRRVPFSLKDLDTATVFRRPKEVIQSAIDLYDGAIRESDASIGDLLHSLFAAGLRKDTLTIIASDHGEEFEDHGRLGHGQTLYREVVQVPLIFHWPDRIPAGERLGSVSLVDVFDTVLDLLSIPPPSSPRDGTSIAPLLLSSGSSSATTNRLLHLDIEAGSAVALIEGDDKLILSKKPYGKKLFDVRSDPAEERNLFDMPEEASVVERLLADIAASYNELSQRSMRIERGPLSESTAKKLMALGYLMPHETPRRIPPRVSVADLNPAGLLGWETAAPATCIHVAELAYETQLLEGWFYPELGGRWAEPQATLLLRPPEAHAQPLRLLLTGESFRPDIAHLGILINGRASFESTIRPGAFKLEFDIHDRTPENPFLVMLSTDPPFRPGRNGNGDHRELGMFFRTACVAAGTAEASGGSSSPEVSDP